MTLFLISMISGCIVYPYIAVSGIYYVHKFALKKKESLELQLKETFTCFNVSSYIFVQTLISINILIGIYALTLQTLTYLEIYKNPYLIIYVTPMIFNFVMLLNG
jgi:hypothetical protein